jgi:methylase of polypeptide subunit release factors
MRRQSEALLGLGRALARVGYRFIAVTPATQLRWIERRRRCGRRRAESLRDVFGWNLPFDHDAIGSELHDLLQAADACVHTEDGWRATVRVSTLGERLFVHSGFPTEQEDAVFFGPDTYRFVDFVRRSGARGRRLVDVGCGGGAGGIMAHDFATEIVLADVNDSALEHARVNAALAGLPVEIVRSDVLGGVTGEIDVVIANPPYMLDDASRTYRDGGGSYGEAVAVRIAREAFERLAPRGTLLVYTGAAIVDGVDTFRRAVDPVLHAHAASFDYVELDPDVFGEELDRPAYAEVERIAVVGLRATLP